VAQRIAGASVAVVLVVGGIALVRPVLSFSGGASGSSAQGTSAGDTSAERTTTVICHDASGTTQVPAVRAGLPASALAACSAAIAAAATAAPSTRPNAVEGRTPTPTPTPLLCESPAGVLHVYVAGSGSCEAHDLLPYGG